MWFCVCVGVREGEERGRKGGGEEEVQSNLCYPGALGLGRARNSDLSVSQNTI